MTARVSHETLLAPERYELTAGSAYEFAWEHREATDLGPKMLRVSRDVLEGLHHGAKSRGISNTNGILAPPVQERTPENACEASQRRPQTAAARSQRWRCSQDAAAPCQSSAQRGAARLGAVWTGG
jgi:hypothetical protein